MRCITRKDGTPLKDRVIRFIVLISMCEEVHAFRREQVCGGRTSLKVHPAGLQTISHSETSLSLSRCAASK